MGFLLTEEASLDSRNGHALARIKRTHHEEYNYLAAALLAVLAASPALSEQLTQAQKIAVKLCSSCHGQDGNSISSNYPKIAGQQANYIDQQLRSFRDHSRSDKDAKDVMWGWTRSLTDQDIRDLAAYYGVQQPKAGKPGPLQLTRMGAAIYQNGLSDKAVPGCAACHGAAAKGSEAAPRLAGQHARYLVRQLKVFRSMERPAAIAMHAVVTNLTDDDIAALAAYLQSR